MGLMYQLINALITIYSLFNDFVSKHNAYVKDRIHACDKCIRAWTRESANEWSNEIDMAWNELR